MNLSGSLVVGLFTHPWAPLVVCLPLLSIGYLLLVQSEMNQYDKLIAHALPDFPIAEVSPDEAAPMHVFDSAEAVLPWLGQQALAANVALQEVTQLQDQTGLAVRLKADFSQTAAFLQRLFYATNLVIEPSVQMELGANVVSPLEASFQLRIQPLDCLQNCAPAPLTLVAAERFIDGFAQTQTNATRDTGVHYFKDVTAAELRWVGRLHMFAQTYNLVRNKEGEILLIQRRARLGLERVVVAALPGWTPLESV
jgi:hypothetical protein